MFDAPTIEELRERLTPLVESARSPNTETSLKLGTLAVLLGLDTAKLFRGPEAAREQQAAADAVELERLREEVATLRAAAEPDLPEPPAEPVAELDDEPDLPEPSAEPSAELDEEPDAMPSEAPLEESPADPGPGPERVAETPEED